jgi:hypothetical protein
MILLLIHRLINVNGSGFMASGPGPRPRGRPFSGGPGPPPLPAALLTMDFEKLNPYRPIIGVSMGSDSSLLSTHAAPLASCRLLLQQHNGRQ